MMNFMPCVFLLLNNLFIFLCSTRDQGTTLYGPPGGTLAISSGGMDLTAEQLFSMVNSFHQYFVGHSAGSESSLTQRRTTQ